MNNQYVLDWLLKAGGYPNIVAIITTPTGTVRKGPLHYAASRGDECLDVLYVLLECRETDLNLKNTDGMCHHVRSDKLNFRFFIDCI